MSFLKKTNRFDGSGSVYNTSFFSSAEGGDVSAIQTPEIVLKEWVWSRNNQYNKAEFVKAEPLGWAVPTIQRLWFGSTVDDKRRRLRAFLTCLNSDSALMLHTSYVPQHMLILACVLRLVSRRSNIKYCVKVKKTSVIS